MARKRQEYFRAGVHMVWQVNPRTRTVEVFTTPDQSTVLPWSANPGRWDGITRLYIAAPGIIQWTRPARGGL